VTVGHRGRTRPRRAGERHRRQPALAQSGSDHLPPRRRDPDRRAAPLEPAPRLNDDSRISIEDDAVAVIDEAEQGRALGRRITVAY
jgi:hypothetical protein